MVSMHKRLYKTWLETTYMLLLFVNPDSNIYPKTLIQSINHLFVKPYLSPMLVAIRISSLLQCRFIYYRR